MEDASEATDEETPVRVERAPPAPVEASLATLLRADVAVEKAPPASEVREVRIPPWACGDVLV